jgi:branched-chain amino acid transport system permease protein
MSTVIIGLSIGMLLLLLSVGLTLIFGMLGVINFAHGALFMLGAYLSFQVTRWTGSFFPALIIVPIIVGVLGAAMEALLIRPLYGRAHVQQLLMTFGVILVVEEAVRLLWGLDYKHLAPPASLSGSTVLLGATVSVYRLFVIAVGSCVAAVLLLTIERSRIGMVLRACSSNPAMAQCVGIRIERVRTLTFAVGCALAAIGGAMSAPMLPIQLGMGFSIIIDCFMIVIAGGLGNIRGTVIIALAIGQLRAFGQQFVAEWVDIVTYSLLLAIFLFRPSGLFGVVERRA